MAVETYRIGEAAALLGIRVEGREYEVREGDVIHVRFSV